MKKTYKIFSVAAAALQLLALLVYFVIILLQRQLKPLMASPNEIISIFNFPIASTLYILLLTGAVLIICLGAFLKGRSSWAEIFGILLLILVCPFLSRFGTILETTLFVSPRGATYLASFSTVQSLTGFAMSITDVSGSLALVAAGMGMVLKKLAPAA